VEVLEKVKGDLQRSGYEQIPQFSSLNPIDVNTKFDLHPDGSRGTKRAVMIGINYIGTFYIMERDTCNFIRPTIILSSERDTCNFIRPTIILSSHFLIYIYNQVIIQVS